MIKEYFTGKEFINENRVFLLKNPHMTGFFFFDESLLTQSNKYNFAIKVESDKYKLLAMKVEPFGLMLYGAEYLLEDLLFYLITNKYHFTNILCPKQIGDHLLNIGKNKFNLDYYEALALDFMEAKSKTEDSDKSVQIPNINDLDQLFDMNKAFLSECNLDDATSKNAIKSHLSNYRVIKIDDKVVSMGASFEMQETSVRISNVYTLHEYRGQGYSRKIVNYLKNEALDKGKTAVLNVDRYNPVTNHLYRELGFEVLFSQGEYRLR